MWYRKSNARMLFLIGAAVLLIGMGMIRMDRTGIGVILSVIGITAAAIGFKILRFHLNFGSGKG